MVIVALIRGKYLNNFEGQNYVFNKNNTKIDVFKVPEPDPNIVDIDFSSINNPVPKLEEKKKSNLSKFL